MTGSSSSGGIIRSGSGLSDAFFFFFFFRGGSEPGCGNSKSDLTSASDFFGLGAILFFSSEYVEDVKVNLIKYLKYFTRSSSAREDPLAWVAGLSRPGAGMEGSIFQRSST